MNFDSFTRIAYLGPEASFPEIAKDYFCEKYGIKAYATPMPTVREVMEYVRNTPNVLGIVPIENSIVGTVRETLDNLITAENENLQILSETIIPIHYCLLARTTEFYSITGIIANQQAMGQCNNFIKTELPRNLNLVEATNPPEAARMLQNYNLTYASIGSKKIAEVYNLNVLKENINDDKSNCTSFVLIGSMETCPTGNDKTTLMFKAEDRPGSLMEILNIFFENNINLSYISSQRTKDDINSFIFVVSFDGHIKDNNIALTVNQVKEKSAYLKILGSYEK